MLGKMAARANLPQGPEQPPAPAGTSSKALGALSLHCSPSLGSVQGQGMSGLFSFPLSESFKTPQESVCFGIEMPLPGLWSEMIFSANAIKTKCRSSTRPHDLL